MGKYVGVDGCKAGWIAVTDEGVRCTFRLFATMRELLDAYPEGEVLLIDIPIGLPWGDCRSRPCDTAARKLLGSPRASSVFPAPCRAAAHAASVAIARAQNIGELGKSLSEQAWGICKKIAEVDALLRADLRARTIIREVHPEVCFRALNGGQTMAHSKRTPDGLRERLSVLSRREPHAATLLADFRIQVRRKDAQADDLLDAMVAYVTARAEPVALATPANSHTHDECGVPMEMVYAT